MFKQTCTNFLNNITALRSTAINDAVNKALKNEHEPYVKEMNDTAEALILEERNKTAELIRTLQTDLERKVNTITAETRDAINKNREKVVSIASKTASANYDNFILDVSKLVDNANIE